MYGWRSEAVSHSNRRRRWNFAFPMFVRTVSLIEERRRGKNGKLSKSKIPSVTKDSWEEHTRFRILRNIEYLWRNQWKRFSLKYLQEKRSGHRRNQLFPPPPHQHWFTSSNPAATDITPGPFSETQSRLGMRVIPRLLSQSCRKTLLAFPFLPVLCERACPNLSP